MKESKTKKKNHVVLHGDFLRDLRKLSGMNLEDAAHDLHINSRTLSRYEKGEKPTPFDIQCRMLSIYFPKGGQTAK